MHAPRRPCPFELQRARARRPPRPARIGRAPRARGPGRRLAWCSDSDKPIRSLPSGRGACRAKLGAPNTQACLAVEQVRVTSGTTGSRASGAAIRCVTAARGADLELRGLRRRGRLQRRCGPARPERVRRDDVRGPGGRRDHRRRASPRPDQSKLCLERAGGAVSNGTPIELNTCNGGDAQKASRRPCAHQPVGCCRPGSQ